jgi:hypothetical protein
MPTAPFEHPAAAKAKRPASPAFEGYRAERVNALRERRRQLEQHLERCRTAASAASDALRPSVGREMDDTRASLATVRSELSRLS